MYNRREFKIDNHKVITEFVNEYPLAFVIGQSQDQYESSLLPFIIKNHSQSSHKTGDHSFTLQTHLAINNPLVTLLKKNEGRIQVNFLGPQRYISPSIYINKLNVPTWNYSTIQIRGVAKIKDSQKDILQILTDSIIHFEKQNQSDWTFDLPEEYTHGLMQAIIGLEVEIHNIETKFKLSQNRQKIDNQAVFDFLSKSSNPKDQEMLIWMKKIASDST